MPKGSEELFNARREEIISACETLYRSMSFKDVTIKEIGSATSFTRTSIYNYFQTKEEIFLALLEREYDKWVAELTDLLNSHDALSAEELSSALARTLSHRELLLKIMSMNHYDMEENSRPDRLAEFKSSYRNLLQTVSRCLEKFLPRMTEKDRQDFLYVFFPFVYGIYPYADVAEKRYATIENAEEPFARLTVYELAYTCIKKLLISPTKS